MGSVRTEPRSRDSESPLTVESNHTRAHACIIITSTIIIIIITNLTMIWSCYHCHFFISACTVSRSHAAALSFHPLRLLL